MDKRKSFGGWIPVADCLPEDGEDVLMYFESNLYLLDDSDNPERKKFIGVGFQFFGNWHVVGRKNVVCYAWQPLPGPYPGV